MGWESRFAARLWLCLVGMTVVCCAFGNVTGGYSSVTSSSLVYVRLTQTGNSLTGYIQTLQESDLWGAGYEARTQSVSGQIEGKNFVLNSVMQGTTMGPSLRLEFPGADGRSSNIVVSPMSLFAWNAHVSKFEDKQALRVKVRDFGSAFTDYCKGADSEATDAARTLHEVQAEKDASSDYDKLRTRDAAKTLADVDTARKIFRTPEAIQALKRLANGRLELALVGASAKFYFYPSVDSLSAQSVRADCICCSLKINNSWSLVLLSGRLYWLKTSDRTPKGELAYSP